jgi:hypothetical protein
MKLAVAAGVNGAPQKRYDNIVSRIAVVMQERRETI